MTHPVRGDTLDLDAAAPESCAPAGLTTPVARALASAVGAGRIPYARLVRCARGPGADVVYLEVDVEVAQVRVHDIRPTEPLAVYTPYGDAGDPEALVAEIAPRVLALRPDFPDDVPHLLLERWRRPASLCLYDVPFRDVRADWTPARFIAHIRRWLALTARGQLHGDDQPLEPLLGGARFRLVLPHILLGSGAGAVSPPATLRRLPSAAADSDESRADPGVLAPTIPPLVPLELAFAADDGARLTLVAASVAAGSSPTATVHAYRPLTVAPPSQPARAPQATPRERPGFAAGVLACSPRPHGTLRRVPGTLADLAAMLAEHGDDLLGTLRAALWQWDRSPDTLGRHLALVLLVPHTRTVDGPVERVDAWAFVTEAHAIAALGVAIGAWAQNPDGTIAPGMLIGGGPTGDGGDVPLLTTYPTFTATRDDLARANGRAGPDNRDVVAIGAGALGSQVLLLAARAAFGRWTVVDDDVLLPHNIARHALPRNAVGVPKAHAVAVIANDVADDAPAFASITDDVVDALVPPRESHEQRPTADGGREGATGATVDDAGTITTPGVAAVAQAVALLESRHAAVRDALATADAILDCSASVTAARTLARDLDASARRVSLFLTPRGTDLVLLAEDAARSITLDALEMQHYRAARERVDLARLFAPADGRRRYGRSCRDVSAVLPGAAIATHAALGVQAVERALDDPAARMRVWRLDVDSLAVHAVDVPVAEVVTVTCDDGWQLVTDRALLARLAALRTERLPRETGGPLLGRFDLTRRIAYVADALPSPPDSVEQPTGYVRGAIGLEDAVAEAGALTAGQLAYIGDWHSHPDGVACRPSADDDGLLAWLADHMAADGVPAVMLIVGEHGAVTFLLDVSATRIADLPTAGGVGAPSAADAERDA